MTDRPSDDDELDPSDWLTSQFEQTGEVKKPAEPTAPEPTAPPVTAPQVTEPPVTQPPTAAPPAWEPPTLVNPIATVPPASVPPPVPVTPAASVPPAATPPADPPAGGFSWGLQPGATQQPAAPATEPPVELPAAASAPPVPPPLVEPPLPVPPPLVAPPATVAVSPPPVEPTTLEPAAVEPAADAPAWDQPTQAIEAMPAELAAPSIPAPTPPAADAPPEPEPAPDPYAGVGAAELLGAAALASEPGSTSPLDALFGDDNFRDYEAEPVPTQSPFARVASNEPAQPVISPTRITRTQKILLAVAGGLVALLALAALFLLGTRLAAVIGPAPAVTPSASPSPSPSPSPTVEPVGPVAVGVWAWDELRGGECLDPYTDPWAEEFTVVDCANPHPAQMAVRGTFAPSAEGVTTDPYPGAEALQGQLALLCTAPGVLDLAVAGQYPDVQFQGTYPATAEQWDEGNRYYYCFVSRSSGEPLTGSVAVPPAPAG